MHDRNPPCPRVLTFKPPRIALSLLGIAAALHFISPPAWPAVPSAPMAGGLLAALGFGIMIRAWWVFRAVDTAVCPTHDSRVLITGDVYRLTRNPMYLGMVLMLLGAAAVFGSLPFYVATLTFFFVIEYTFCPFEESRLQAQFGGAFEEYRSRVRRWL
ncbi:MAG: isoprenylcysteine carboxylmethyltransferase family protein [Woeseiaceae bacterium]|nr:isoprenylcysteine carboxylmethyltransferase family protein [Woeseiaceae bacterium]